MKTAEKKLSKVNVKSHQNISSEGDVLRTENCEESADVKDSNKSEELIKLKVEKSRCQKKAISYLKTWRKNRSNWKFEKVRQVWLIKHMFNRGQVPSKSFKILVDYIAGSKGIARQTVINSAQTVIQAMELWTELKEKGLSHQEILSEHPHLQEINEDKYLRARKILQSIEMN